MVFAMDAGSSSEDGTVARQTSDVVAGAETQMIRRYTIDPPPLVTIREDALEAFEGGSSCYELAARFGGTAASWCGALRLAGYSPHGANMSRLPPDLLADIAAMRRDGKTFKQIAEVTGKTRNAIAGIVFRHVAPQ